MFLPTKQNSTSPSHIIEATSTAASNGSLVYGLILLTVTLIFAIRRYLRSRFPCLTMADMDEKEKVLIEVFGRAPKIDDLPCYAREQGELSRRLLELKERACQIRIKSLQLDETWAAAIWRIYLGVHPQILFDLITWHDDAEALRLHILIIINSVRCSYYQGQLSFRPKLVPFDIERPAFDAPGSSPSFTPSFHKFSAGTALC